MSRPARLALVTGASGGIGQAIALALAKAGYDLILSGRQQNALAETCRRCLEYGGQAQSIRGDLAEPGTVEALEQGVNALGQLHALVHAAASHSLGGMVETSASRFAQPLNLDVVPAYRLTRALLPALIHGKGDLVFLNSTQGEAAGAGVVGYAVAKYALRGLADALRAEFNPLGIRVLSVFCGKTATQMQQRIYEARSEAYDPAAATMLQPADIATIICSALTLPPNAEITELRIRPRRKS